MGAVHEVGGFLQRLVLPVDCSGCGRAGPALCGACRAALTAAPRGRAVGGVPVTSALDYEGVVRQVVVAFKNEGATVLAPPLAAALRTAVAVALGDGPGSVALVPMPTSRRSRVERGYDPVRVLLRRARLPHRDVLRLVRRPQDQLALGREGRFANVAAGMRASPAMAGVRVLLVDDVVTSGATLAEAARATAAAGGLVVGAATVASTPGRAIGARLP